MTVADSLSKSTTTLVLASAIIAIAMFLALASSRDDSIIVDEIPHIGAGYSYWIKSDMRLNPEHPPLAKDIAAFPLLFLNLKQNAFDSRFWQQDINGQWEFGRLLIFNSGNDADQIKHWTKIPMLLLFVLSALLIFKWGRKLYGDTGAIIALVLFAFSPTVITHSRFVTTDVPALFGILLATYYLMEHFKNPKRYNLIIAGLAFGIALLCKFSTFLLVPYFFLLALMYGLTRVHNKLANCWQLIRCVFWIFVIGFVFVVWPVYYLHTYKYPPDRQYHDTQQLLSSYGNRAFADPVVWASDKPVLRAAAQYSLGLLMVNQRALGGNTTYFLGDVSRIAWRKYFPIVYFIKEPLAWWGLVIISMMYLVWQWKYPFKETINRVFHVARNYPEESAMLLWLLIYWAVSISGNLNIGVRHLLPIYPFAILLVTGQIIRILNKYKTIDPGHKLTPKSSVPKFTVWILLFGLLGWYIYENVKTYPHYLSYFNQVAGGPAGGYKYVVDSNLDWGQDLVRFSNWVKENNIPKIEFDYFGWADPSYYLRERYTWSNSTKYRDALDFKLRNQSDGWMAVSATFLMGSQGSEDFPNPVNYIWLNSYEPVTIIGNSIFVYRIK